MKQKRFYSYALATSLLISSFGGLVNVSAATYQDAEEVKARTCQHHENGCISK